MRGGVRVRRRGQWAEVRQQRVAHGSLVHAGSGGAQLSVTAHEQVLHAHLGHNPGYLAVDLVHDRCRVGGRHPG
jgi:hypothetical protein